MSTLPSVMKQSAAISAKAMLKDRSVASGKSAKLVVGAGVPCSRVGEAVGESKLVGCA